MPVDGGAAGYVGIAATLIAATFGGSSESGSAVRPFAAEPHTT
jgi:hypothetical protein